MAGTGSSVQPSEAAMSGDTKDSELTSTTDDFNVYGLVLGTPIIFTIRETRWRRFKRWFRRVVPRRKPGPVPFAYIASIEAGRITLDRRVDMPGTTHADRAQHIAAQELAAIGRKVP
jgi:hypothetical protein